jgi:hypothetical protein
MATPLTKSCTHRQHDITRVSMSTRYNTLAGIVALIVFTTLPTPSLAVNPEALHPGMLADYSFGDRTHCSQLGPRTHFVYLWAVNVLLC